MKKTLLFVLALAVIPVGVDAQVSSLEQMRPLAEEGDMRAQFILGSLYDDGEGVPEDDAEAIRWYRLAAEQGAVTAQVLLGIKYWEGEGVPEDFVLAYMWLNLGAAQGHENGQELKDILEQQMTREQIAEAQRLSREWIEAHPSGN